MAMNTMLSLLLAVATPQETLKFRESAKQPDVEGEVVALTLQSVEILSGGVKQTFDARLLADIVPSAARKTTDFAKGEEAIANNDFASAIPRFERVATDARAPESLRQIASIQVVRCAAASRNPAGVVQAAQVMRARKADGYFVRESFVLEIQAHLELGSPAGAMAAHRAFAAQFPGHPDVGMMQAAMDEHQGNWRAALAIHRNHLKDPEVGDAAALGEMRCLTALGDWPGLGGIAEAHLKSTMGGKKVHPRILIASYTARGDVEVNGGKAKDALLNYLQGAMVLAKGAASPEHEAALARTSLACAKLAAAEKEPKRKDRYRGQAREMLQELNKTYPGSRHRAEVEKAVAGLR